MLYMIEYKTKEVRATQLQRLVWAEIGNLITV